MKHTFIFIVSGLAVGIAIGFLLPHSWVFVEDPMTMQSAAGDGIGYVCPMFCVVLDELPADRSCPVCGMELAPIDTSGELDDHERHMIGLELAKLEERELFVELRLTGEVDYDESRLGVVSSRAAGWLETVSSKVTWEEVKQGETLFELYSPEVFTAQQGYLVARERGGTLLDSARAALLNLGVAETEIERIGESGKPLRTLPYRAPRGGVIVRRRAVEGAHVKAGEEVYAVASLDEVWLQMEVFESDLPWLGKGREIEVKSQLPPFDTFTGKVIFIDPVIDRRSRVARARIVVKNRRTDNGQWAFLPGQRIRSVVRVPIGAAGGPAAVGVAASEILALPRSAVLRTGQRSVVYLMSVVDADGRASYRFDADNASASIAGELVQVLIGPLVRGSEAQGDSEGVKR